MTLLDQLLPYQKKFVQSEARNKFFLCSRQAGKSFCSAYIACHEALVKDNSVILVISTGSRASEEWLNKAEQFAQAIQVLSDNFYTYDRTSDKLIFSNGSRILSLPSGNPTSLRGYTAQCVIIDECFFIERPNEVLAAINPTLTRSQDSKFILCSTPGSKLSPFYQIYCDAKVSNDWYVQTTTIDDCIRDGLKVDIERLKQLCPDPNIFDIEYRCQFASSSGSLIDTSLLQSYVDIKDPIIEYYIGVDWARTSDGTSISILGRDKNDINYLIDVINIHNVDYDRQINVVKETFLKYQPKMVYCDAGGLGSPLVEQLNKTVSARIKPFNFTSTSKPQSYEYFRKTVFDRKLKIKDDLMTLLLEDISLVQQIITENGKIVYSSRRLNGSHADNLTSLILALQASHDSPSNFTLPSASLRQSKVNQIFGLGFTSRLK